METTFNQSDVASLLRIAGEVGELPRDLTLRRRHILNRLLGLIGGLAVVCSEVDPRYVNGSGWAVPNSITCSDGLTAHHLGLISRYLTGHHFSVDPCIPPLLRDPNPVVTFRREDVVDRSWYRSEHYNEVRKPLGFGESIYGKLITPDGRHLKLTLHREISDAPFTERDVQLMHVFNENLASLYITQPRPDEALPALQKDDPRIASLPPRVRPVLQRLLAGDAEKQAAIKLGLSPHTVHEYAKLLHRTFNVNSRSELMALFVSGPVM